MFLISTTWDFSRCRVFSFLRRGMQNVSREILTSDAFLPLYSESFHKRERGWEREEKKWNRFSMARDADRKFGKSITKISNFQPAIISSFHVLIIVANRNNQFYLLFSSCATPFRRPFHITNTSFQFFSFRYKRYNDTTRRWKILEISKLS